MKPATDAPAATTNTTYAELCTRFREVATINSVGSLVSWDQETYMPPAAGAHRAEQMALLSSLSHARQTDPKIGELLSACEADSVLNDPASETGASLREMRREYDNATKLPAELVAELARTGSLAQDAWKDARAKSDFPMFQPWLEKMLGLSRQKAECLGAPSGELYDALLDLYEPGATATEIAGVFTPLRDRLATFVAELGDKGTRPDDSVLKINVSEARQHAFGQAVLKQMGFDFAAGRLDTTTHPFCSGMAPGDTRLTTRYDETHFTGALYGTMHEGGHGVYEQGLPKAPELAKYGTPLADSISLGIHESQSRMWENLVGRSHEFWTWAKPVADDLLGDAIRPYDAEAIFKAVNIVEPSFIRVEADEGTYNLHVMLRFELERAMLAGDLSVADLPGAWNEKVKSFLGLDVPDDANGCLQDVHWSFGLMGYFPTYTLGNLYAAQLWETINEQIDDLPGKVSRGELLPLLEWLQTNVYAHGRRYRAGELCERLTGKPLSADPLMRYLEGKIRPVYGL